MNVNGLVKIEGSAETTNQCATIEVYEFDPETGLITISIPDQEVDTHDLDELAGFLEKLAEKIREIPD